MTAMLSQRNRVIRPMRAFGGAAMAARKAREFTIACFGFAPHTDYRKAKLLDFRPWRALMGLGVCGAGEWPSGDVGPAACRRWAARVRT